MEKNKEINKHSKPEPDDEAGIVIQGHVLIKDKTTGKELVNKRSA